MSFNSEVKFTALSGGIPIGGSHYLVELEGKRIAIDCGAVQRGGKVLPPPIAKGKVDALFLTHGHFDHSGMLPLFVKEHPETPIYSTKVTWRFTRMLLWDICRNASIRLSRGEKVENYFTPAEVENAVSFRRFKLVHNPAWFSPWKGWKIRFWPAGHINGAASIYIISPKGFRIIHSGDVCFHNQPTIKGMQIAYDFRSPNLLITEATNGNRNLPKRAAEEKRFVDRVIGILWRGGKVLIPSFGITGPNIGIILASGLAKAGVNIPVYLDGMIRMSATIINASNEWSKNDNGLVFPDNLVAVPEEQEEAYACRKKILDGGPAVVVSSHGMLEGGFAMFYLPHILSDYKSAVLIPGHQVEGSGGRLLLELGRGHEFQIKNKSIPRNCDVERFHLSSHASGKDLSNWISEIQPWQVIVTHATESGFLGLKHKVKSHHPITRVLGGYNGEEIRDL